MYYTSNELLDIFLQTTSEDNYDIWLSNLIKDGYLIEENGKYYTRYII